MSSNREGVSVPGDPSDQSKNPAPPSHDPLSLPQQSYSSSSPQNLYQAPQPVPPATKAAKSSATAPSPPRRRIRSTNTLPSDLHPDDLPFSFKEEVLHTLGATESNVGQQEKGKGKGKEVEVDSIVEEETVGEASLPPSDRAPVASGSSSEKEHAAMQGSAGAGERGSGENEKGGDEEEDGELPEEDDEEDESEDLDGDLRELIENARSFGLVDRLWEKNQEKLKWSKKIRLDTSLL